MSYYKCFMFALQECGSVPPWTCKAARFFCGFRVLVYCVPCLDRMGRPPYCIRRGPGALSAVPLSKGHRAFPFGIWRDFGVFFGGRYTIRDFADWSRDDTKKYRNVSRLPTPPLYRLRLCMRYIRSVTSGGACLILWLLHMSRMLAPRVRTYVARYIRKETNPTEFRL